MPNPQTEKGSEFSQNSFSGGMNLLGDDTTLGANQYRVGFNLTNRLGTLDPIASSEIDPATPVGVIQELRTFGNYIIIFVSGLAYYRYYSDTGWRLIEGFKMSSDAPRFWTEEIPVTTTNYIRIAATGEISDTPNPAGGIQLSSVVGAAAGDIPGLIVQDNVSQPQFIFIDGSTGLPTTRTIQTFNDWSITFTDADNVTIAPEGDKREYVPIGNCMTYDDGILYIVSQDFGQIYRSVSGRPLDFVINVKNTLETEAPYKQTGGGDASTTAYSVGVGGITCIRKASGGGIFVSASGANFLVSKNTNANAPTIFGEYTFLRDFLFNSNCLSDRVIFDSIGDTRFIDLNGVRSFNAIQQTQNEGRNLPFTSTIQGAFIRKLSDNTYTNIIQDYTKTAAILFNDYELYALETVFGPVIAKYDTINGCWTSFDTDQTNGKAIKILAKIELQIQRLYAVTEDNKLYTLYINEENKSTASFRSVGVCANILVESTNVRLANPKNEIKLSNVRVVLNRITKDCICSFTPYINNRLSSVRTIQKSINYTEPTTISNEEVSLNLPDINTQLNNMLYSTPDCEQGWKVCGIFEWNEGSFTQFSFEMVDLTPQNPLDSQGTTV